MAHISAPNSSSIKSTFFLNENRLRKSSKITTKIKKFNLIYEDKGKEKLLEKHPLKLIIIAYYRWTAKSLTFFLAMKREPQKRCVGKIKEWKKNVDQQCYSYCTTEIEICVTMVCALLNYLSSISFVYFSLFSIIQ